MTMPDEHDIRLDDFFDAARAEAPVPSAALLGRVLADAGAEQAAWPVRGAVAAPARGGVLAAILGLLGGWPAVAGMASAAVAGLWIGVAAPDTVTGLAGLSSATTATATADSASYELGDLLPGLDLIGEGS